MRNRLLLGLFAATSVIALVALTGRFLGLPGTAQAGGWGVSKTTDSPTVVAGHQMGFYITVVNQESFADSIYIRDELPGAAGTNWMIESAVVSTSPQGNGAVPTPDCSIQGSPPSQTLRCVHVTSTDFYLKVHVISATTAEGCGDYHNTASGSVGGTEDHTSQAFITVVCPSPTPSPTPSPSPSPSPTPIIISVFGGHDDQGDNMIIFLPPPGGNTLKIDGFEIPLGPACPGQKDTFEVPGIPLGGDKSFDKQDGAHRVQGQITDENGLQVAQGYITVDVATSCENTLAFVAEQSDRALLVGDINCDWPAQFAAAAGGIAFPQGPTPAPTPAANPKKGITVKDVIETLKWLAGFAEDSPPLDCPLLAAAFPTPVPGSATPAVTPTSTPRPVHLQGDADCSGTISDKDVLELLQFVAGLDQPSCGGVKVGHFWLLDK